MAIENTVLAIFVLIFKSILDCRLSGVLMMRYYYKTLSLNLLVEYGARSDCSQFAQGTPPDAGIIYL